MNDFILKQLEFLVEHGVKVSLCTATTFQVSGDCTWFYVNTETQEVSNSNGHDKETYAINTLARYIINRHHTEWLKKLTSENIYKEPSRGWAKLYILFDLPYRLSFK